MPLIDNSDYRQYVEVSRGSKIGAAGDPHAEALAHVVLGLNPESDTLQQYRCKLRNSQHTYPQHYRTE